MSQQSPFHPKFQEACLAAMWRDSRLLPVLGQDRFKPAFLQDPTCSHLASIIQGYFNKYAKAPSRESLFELIRKSYPDINDPKHTAERSTLERKVDDLSEMDVSDFEFIKDKIGKFMQWRAIIQMVHKTVDVIKNGDVPEEVVDWFSEAIKQGTFDVKVGTPVREKITNIIRQEVSTDYKPRRPTGLSHFDHEIGGGLRAGELGCLLAPPKGFKSGTLLNFAFHGLKRGVGTSKKVLYLTLELSEELQALRFAVRTTMLPKEQMFIDTDNYIKTFQDRADVIFDDEAELYIAYFAPYVCTPQTIRTYLDQMKREAGVEFDSIMIDYLDLMGSDTKSDKDYLEKVRICTDLRAIAVDYDLPIWTACRATREATGKKRISMAHMAGAFERVAICDLVVALCQTDQERVSNVMRIVPVACRNDGGNRQIICRFEPSRMAIWSVEARDLTDDDFDDEDEPSYKKKSGGGGYKKRKDDESDDDEAVFAGMKKLNALRDKRKSLVSGRVSIEEELLNT